MPGLCHALMSNTSWRHLDTHIGTLALTASPLGLAQVTFTTSPALSSIQGTTEDHQVCEKILDDAAHQISEYLSGSRTGFNLPLDLSTTTAFHRTVLNELQTIPYGQTVSYRDLATLIGHPQASRAVGSACAKNPLPVVIPCHRVLRSDGELGGYLGGPVIKRFLLDMEAHHITSCPPPA
ncbi:methylated-DNA--[protein]-cysteine S-methyltransferase [Cutibacterium sp. V947]|uniref:methylated-DNA--[protein]-cysteine S-methyltransferase n=1 Tax=Cutibacterium sp. V947 TaxID=3446480 RepID=UPI003EE1A481